ncbi:MAG: hypothetical protein HC877_19310 [Thioploca sp.]|nr:hypothetical protein [Thioploca sp.]
MQQYAHLKLLLFAENVERQKKGGGGGYKLPKGRNKLEFSQQAIQDANNIKSNFTILKNKFSGNLNPTLIFEIEINQSVSPDNFEKELTGMDIHVLSVAENKRGYWVIFADDIELTKFKNKLEIYGQPDGHNGE